MQKSFCFTGEKVSFSMFCSASGKCMCVVVGWLRWKQNRENRNFCGSLATFLYLQPPAKDISSVIARPRAPSATVEIATFTVWIGLLTIHRYEDGNNMQHKILWLPVDSHSYNLNIFSVEYSKANKNRTRGTEKNNETAETKAHNKWPSGPWEKNQINFTGLLFFMPWYPASWSFKLPERSRIVTPTS